MFEYVPICLFFCCEALGQGLSILFPAFFTFDLYSLMFLCVFLRFDLVLFASFSVAFLVYGKRKLSKVLIARKSNLDGIDQRQPPAGVWFVL